jgi:hypothetical protein
MRIEECRLDDSSRDDPHVVGRSGMTDLLMTVGDLTIADRFLATRSLTESLASPLSAEDQTVQSMPDVSPTKWHRAHTTWFFETFLLIPTLEGYEPFHPEFGYLFNSYYEGVGARHPRSSVACCPAPASRPSPSTGPMWTRR